MTAKAWFVVCCMDTRPDGPGRVFGPFASRDLAHEDTLEADETSCAVGNRHLIVFGEGGSDVLSSMSEAWNRSYEYFNAHPAEIPESCASMFKTALVGAGTHLGQSGSE